MSARFYFHPILQNSKSRKFLVMFLCISFFAALGFNWYVELILKRAGIVRYSMGVMQNPFRILISIHFRSAVILLSSLFSAGLTAWHITGPYQRIEQWLKDWNDGLNPFPLVVRKNDKLFTLVKLLNTLYQKIERPQQPYS